MAKSGEELIPLRLIILALLILFILACGPYIPTSQQLETADYGSYPDNYQEIVKSYYSTTLIDPYSAHIRIIKPPEKGHFNAGIQKFKFGYIVSVGVNAKNRMGGYVGEKFERLLINNGKVIDSSPIIITY